MRSSAISALVLVLVLALPGCSERAEGRTLVASLYPLAFAAERIVGPEWEVIDLTPPGTEAHDLELSLRDRAAIQDADLVLYLGDNGFQPQVEEAVHEARGVVVSLAEDSIYGAYVSGTGDVHYWVSPSFIGFVILALCPALDPIDPESKCLTSDFQREADRLHAVYNRELKRADCRYRTLIVSHEAFEVFSLYDLKQFGLSGPVPEAEPSAARLAEAARLVEQGRAGAVFYDEHEDARRTARSFAADAGVPALPLSTLESRPVEGDYFTVMEDNLASLREGLRCR